LKSVRYLPVSDNATSDQRKGFVHAYQEAFSGPPYFETYSFQQVLEEVWYPHIRDGIVVLALDGEQVIGFGCAMPVLKSPPEIKEYLALHQGEGGFPTELNRAWYMSELGVVESHRRHGVGYALVKHRLHRIVQRGDTHYVFRTAAEGSNSIHLYRKLGAIELADLQDVAASDQVQVNGSKSTQRIFLYGSCDSALSELEAAGH